MNHAQKLWVTRINLYNLSHLERWPAYKQSINYTSINKSIDQPPSFEYTGGRIASMTFFATTTGAIEIKTIRASLSQ